MRFILIILVCLFYLPGLSAQKKPPKVWASVTFNKRTVTVGEPLVATVTVYTSTWFTEPPEFGEIQSPNSMTIRLQQRTGSKMARIDGQNYPAIEQKYLIYPLQTGENTFPSLKVILTTPDEGDYKGKRRTVSSPAYSFQVTGLPADIARGRWIVADNISLSENWDRQLENLKTGDVLERRITIRVTGPPAALIPPLPVPEIEFGSVYPRPPVLTNSQNAASLTGVRTEIMTFLLEKSGTFTIPEVKVGAFRPGINRTLEKTIPAREITIADNPNLEFILSMQDSLRSLLAEDENEVMESEPFEFMGLNWWQLLVVALAGLSVLILLFRVIRRIVDVVKRERKERAGSEAAYFRAFLRSAEKKDAAGIKKTLMLWYDRFRNGRYGPAFRDFADRSGTEGLSGHAAGLDRYLYGKEKDDTSWSEAEFADEVKSARAQSLKKKDKEKQALPPLNP